MKIFGMAFHMCSLTCLLRGDIDLIFKVTGLFIVKQCWSDPSEIQIGFSYLYHMYIQVRSLVCLLHFPGHRVMFRKIYTQVVFLKDRSGDLTVNHCV